MDILLHYLSSLLLETWNMTKEMAPWLLLGFLISGLLHSFLPLNWIRKHLADPGYKGVIKAALVGAPLPLCSCGVIPVAKWLRKEGASKNSSLSFLVSTPETGVDSILATIAMLGPIFGVIRPSIAIVSGIAIGLLAARWLPGEQTKDDNSSTCDPTPSQLTVKAKTFGGKIKEAFVYGFDELFADVAKWLLVGLFVGGAITAFVPSDWIQSAGQWGGIGSYLLVIALGVPLYVCATGSIPIAAALLAKGVSPGAVLVFLIVGPATNVATIAFVNGSFGKKTLALYLGTIIGVAFLAGIALDLWAPQDLFTLPQHALHEHQSTDYFSIIFGVLLVILFIPYLYRLSLELWHKILPKKESPMPTGITLTIPQMNCQNCVRHVSKAINSLEGVVDLQVDLPTRQVMIKGLFDETALRKKLIDEGYAPKD